VPTLSVIIPATDRPASLEGAVRAIEIAVSPPEQVIVIDGQEHRVSAAASNAGAWQADGEEGRGFSNGSHLRPR
jgi:hypothetical protein